MLISNIKPYARNARVHTDNIDALMQSIKDFGFHGKIQLVSRDNPTLINGHGRLEALKKLGWKEIPEENIEFVGNLSDEEIKAYRIADNKTAEMSRWNTQLYKSEVAALAGKLDMSKYGCNFKSKELNYGAERLRTDNAYNLQLIDRFDCNNDGYPELKVIDFVPKELQGFNFAKSTLADVRKNRTCHFFIDDYQFERLWNNPEQYLHILQDFEAVLTCDFSMYLDMPRPMMQWNHYRSMALGYYWQKIGIKVIPTLAWAEPDSFDFCFAGIPKHSTLATSTVGVMTSKDAQNVWRAGMSEAIKRLEPKRLLIYGSKIEFDFKDIEVKYYKNTNTKGWQNG